MSTAFFLLNMSEYGISLLALAFNYLCASILSLPLSYSCLSPFPLILALQNQSQEVPTPNGRFKVSAPLMRYKYKYCIIKYKFCNTYNINLYY
jgi:hypothetical protein